MLGSKTLTFGPRSTLPVAGGAALAGAVARPLRSRAINPTRAIAKDHLVLGLRMTEELREKALSARGVIRLRRVRLRRPRRTPKSGRRRRSPPVGCIRRGSW